MSAEEAVRLGISPGTYYLDADMYTSPRRVGNDTYIMVTSHIKTQGKQITVGFGKRNPVLIQGKFLYEKS